MLEAIINFLNLKLELLNYFEQQHCLCELKSDNEGKVAPVEYVGDANYTVISHDEFDGVSYWRLRDKPTQDVLETKYQAGKRVEVKIPLRLVFSVRRTKLTTDDAYAFDRIRQTIVKQFNFDDGVLKTTLGCESVTVSVPTSNGDARNVWDEETSETGTYEPNYSFVYGSIDIEVAVIYKGSCLPTECDDVDSNILHAFDFCKPSVVAQLTPTQVACLEADLCIPLCDQLAEVAPEDVVVDVFDCLSEAAQTELLDSECVIPPCSPVTQQVNGTTIGTTASGGTNNQLIRNTAGTAVGTAANPSVIANTTIRNSATPTWTDSVVAGVTKTLAQGKALDSDGATTLLANYIPAADGFMFTCTPSPPCADATVTINNTLFDTVASGATIDIQVINGGSNPVGSLQGSDWVIGNNMTTINGTQVTDQEAEVNAAIFATLDGSQSGTWNAGTQTWEMTSAACDDATVTINGASLGATGTIPSGGSEDLDVLQGGVATGSWNGSAWIIPTCPVAPSLAVALSSATRNYNDTLTITATPTNFTPTNYIFYALGAQGISLLANQVGAVYAWTVNQLDVQAIYVVATDGVSGQVWATANVTVSSETDAAAFIMATSITDYTQRIAINVLVIGYKAQSIWTSRRAIYPFVGGSATTHKFNLKNPLDTDAAHRLTFSGGWTHSATGALPNGTNAYANTFVNPSSHLTSNNIAISYYSRTPLNTALDQVDIGVITGGNSLYLTTQYNASGIVNRFFSRNCSAVIACDTLNTIAQGYYQSSKTSNAALAFKTFKDGVLQDTDTGGGSNPNDNIYIGAANNSGVAAFFTNRECAFASIGDGMSDAQALAEYNLVQAFQTALIRQR